MNGRARGLTALILVVGGFLLGLGSGLMLESGEKPALQAGPVDIGFAQDMAVHHSQAVVMSGLAMDRAENPQLQMLARQIMVSQAGERGMLQGWLATWNAPALPAEGPMSWMPRGSSGHRHDPGAMPGMATHAQLRRLAPLKGPRFDREFVTLMTRHHAGGIAMARVASKRARLPEVRSLAALMVKDQTLEIATMRRLSQS